MSEGLTLDQELTQRFAADLDALVEPGARIGVAVSGGADSVALLLLAAAARPGLVEAASVDHRVRPENRSEAEQVASLCERLAIPHRILTADSEPPSSNLQAWARDLRYRLLGAWAQERNLDALATGHHCDDQAETLLMRLARGSGIGGLGGIQRSRPLSGRIQLIRPLLDWRRSTLRKLVADAGITPVDDPSNRDERFDRSQVRALLQSAEWIDPQRLSVVASYAIEADQALDWLAGREFAGRVREEGPTILVEPGDLPRELRRRLLLLAIARLGGEEPPGPKLAAALERLEEGAVTTLAGLKMEGGTVWRLSPAPARRHRTQPKQPRQHRSPD